MPVYHAPERHILKRGVNRVSQWKSEISSLWWLETGLKLSMILKPVMYFINHKTIMHNIL